MKTFKDYLTESEDSLIDIKSILNESHDLTEEQDAAIDTAVDRIMEEHKNGQIKFKVMRKQQAEHPIEEVGEKLRKLMPWIAEGKMVDKSKN